MALDRDPHPGNVPDPVTIPVMVPLPFRATTVTNNSGRTLILNPRTFSLGKKLILPQDLPSHSYNQSFITTQNPGKDKAIFLSTQIHSFFYFWHKPLFP